MKNRIPTLDEHINTENQLSVGWVPASSDMIKVLDKSIKGSYTNPVEFQSTQGYSLMIKMQEAAVIGGKHFDMILKSGKFKDYSIHLFNGEVNIAFTK